MVKYFNFRQRELEASRNVERDLVPTRTGMAFVRGAGSGVQGGNLGQRGQNCHHNLVVIFAKICKNSKGAYLRSSAQIGPVFAPFDTWSFVKPTLALYVYI